MAKTHFTIFFLVLLQIIHYIIIECSRVYYLYKHTKRKFIFKLIDNHMWLKRYLLSASLCHPVSRDICTTRGPLLIHEIVKLPQYFQIFIDASMYWTFYFLLDRGRIVAIPQSAFFSFKWKFLDYLYTNISS